MKKTRVTLQEFASIAQKQFGTNILTSEQIKDVAKKNNIFIPKDAWSDRVGRGRFLVGQANTGQMKEVSADESDTAPAKPEVEMVGSIKAIRNADESYMQEVDPHFIKWGNFTDINMIIKSKIFFPAFVTGLSGNGKTSMIEQACAASKREVIRVNFTRETNEDDLVGGMRLIDGDTVFQYGPVAEAYLRGAVLILDELDLADPNKVMVLQGVLEGKPIFIKKLGKKIKPAPGFTVFATANTKGKGSQNGQFIGTNNLNEAFLDRFSITVEQPYASAATELKILKNYALDFAQGKLEEREEEILKNLVQWGQITRDSFLEGSIDELISTRRLVDTVKSYFIFGKDIEKAIRYATNRFEDEVKESFQELYKQIDAGLRSVDISGNEPESSPSSF